MMSLTKIFLFYAFVVGSFGDVILPAMTGDDATAIPQKAAKRYFAETK
jgi:hypothetical protein